MNFTQGKVTAETDTSDGTYQTVTCVTVETPMPCVTHRRRVPTGVRRVVQTVQLHPLDFDNIKIYVKSKIRLPLVIYFQSCNRSKLFCALCTRKMTHSIGV